MFESSYLFAKHYLCDLGVVVLEGSATIPLGYVYDRRTSSALGEALTQLLLMVSVCLNTNCDVCSAEKSGLRDHNKSMSWNGSIDCFKRSLQED